MQHCDYPSPPASEAEKMERGQRLPPISTQLAGYFQEKPETPPISPNDGRQAEYASLKRKRSSDAEASVGDSQNHPPKRPAVVWNPTTASSSILNEPVSRTLTGLSGTSTQAPSPATYPDYRSPFRHAPQSYSRHGVYQSPLSAAPQSYARSAAEYDPTPAFQTRGLPATAHNAAPTIYDRLPSQLSGRALPPLHTPNSPRSAVEGRFEPSLLGESRQLPPPLDSTPGYPSTQGRYSLPPAGPSIIGASARPADTSSYTYPSPQQPAGPASASRHPYPTEPTRSSYSFDPVRHAPYSVEDRRVALPPMPGLSDPLPPPQSVPRLPSATVPAHHALDRYRFDAHASTDHPARRRRGNLPKEATARLNDWFAVHAAYPYPKEEEKQRLQEETGLSMSQIGNWFINARRRRKPLGVNRPVDALPPPPPGRHTFVSQTAPQMPTTLPPPASGHDRLPYDYPHLPPLYR